jgi:transposase
MQTPSTITDVKIAELEAELAVARLRAVEQEVRLAEVEKERDVLRMSHDRLRLELQLLKQRMFFAKAERIDTTQLQLEFAQKLRALDQVAGTLGIGGLDEPSDGSSSGRSQKKRKSTGRRDLSTLPLEERRVEIADPVLDKLVAEGKAERIGYETSYKLAWQRGGMRRLAIARVKYRTVAADEYGDRELATALAPKELIWRCLAAPSLLANILVQKYCDGLPLFRIEQRFSRDGVSLDRGTMCRWVEDLGATFGSSIVAAMREEALRTAFCIATDATGIAIQPVPAGENVARQACRRAHYFKLPTEMPSSSNTLRAKPAPPSRKCSRAFPVTFKPTRRASTMPSLRSRKKSPLMAMSIFAKKLRAGAMLVADFGRRPSRKALLHAKASPVSAASSSLKRRGRIERPMIESVFAMSIFDCTWTLSLLGLPWNTRRYEINGVCFAPHSVTSFVRRTRFTASSTTGGSSSTTTAPREN